MSDLNPPPGAARALILTIHGTNDGKPGGAGDTKWWETSSGFVRGLTQNLDARGLAADVEEFLWGGANSAFAREKGSLALRRRIREAAGTYDEIHLIGHSHGGNVAVDAARRAAWGREPGWRLLGGRPAGITSITTVGTPFLRPLARNSDYLYALFFVGVMLISTLAFALPAAAGFFSLSMLIVDGLPLAKILDEDKSRIPLFVGGASFALFVPFALLLARAAGRFLWIRRLLKRGARRANLLSIWHPKDEAIGGLKRAGDFSPELVPRGALWSSGHRAGTNLGSALFVLFGALIFPLAGLLLVSGPQEIPFAGQQVQIPNIMGDPRLNTALFIIACLAAVCMPAIGVYVLTRLVFTALNWSGGHRAGIKLGTTLLGLFAAMILPVAGLLLVSGPQEIPFAGLRVEILNLTGNPGLNTALFITLCIPPVCMFAFGFYILVRLIFGVGELARGGLNARAVNLLRDFAFGSDTGQKLGEVSERPHFFEGEVWTTPDDLARRMEEETLSALTEFLSRQRASLFSVTGGADWMREVGEDPATWNSLIHTTYFDHPEIAERIAGHIAGTHDDLNPGAPPAIREA